MSRSQVVGTVCAGLAFFVAASEVAAQSADEGAITEMSVEIAITRMTVDQDGQSVGPVTPPTVFTVARTGRPGEWRTVMTYPKHKEPATRAAAHPLDGARIEFDESSGATRVYDAAGESNALLSSESSGGPLGSGGPAQWLDGLIATPATQAQRKRALHDTYGDSVGRVRGLDRFLAYRDGVLHEVLADPASALPVEINTVQDGVLASHLVFDYVRRSNDTWVRRGMRAEQIVPGHPTHRSRLTVEFRNVTTGGR
jgi:hypothetical protein